jgi:hypothetical protein
MIRYFLGCLLLQQVLSAQTPQPIAPAWDISLGHRSFSSRDVLGSLERDAEGRLWLAGSTETDSSFSDIFVQQLDANGVELWRFQYSTDFGNGYDVLLQSFLTSDKGMILLCSSKSIHGSGIGYVLKISESGVLEWVKDMITLVGPHDYSSLFYGFLDGRNILRVTYSTQFGNFEPSKTYFMGIRLNGQVIDAFEKTDIVQPNPARSAAYAVWHDASDYFIFPYYIDTSVVEDWKFRFIHPILQEDFVVSLDTSALDTVSQEFIKTALSVSFVRDPKGNYYTWDHLGFGNGFWCMRMSKTFQAQWIYRSEENLPLALLDYLLPLDSFVLLAGHQESWLKNDAFLWKMNLAGEITDSLTLDYSSFLRPVKLWWNHHTIYLSAEHRLNETAYLFCIDSALQVQWVRPIAPHNHHRFQGQHLLFPEESGFLLGGNYRQHQMFDSSYSTAADFGVLKYSINDTVPEWVHTYNGTGTSGVYRSLGFPLNADAFCLISTEESPYAISPGIYRYTLYRVDAEGQIMSETDLPTEIIPYALFQSRQQDSSGNIYVTGYFFNDSGLMMRISANGQMLDTIAVPGGTGSYVATNDGRVFISSGYKIQEISQDFNQITEYPCEGLAFIHFKAPGSDTVYTWTLDNDSAFLNLPYQIHLYKNGQKVWTHNFLQNPLEVPTYFDTHRPSGDILYLRGGITAFQGTLGVLSLGGTVVAESPTASYAPQAAVFLKNRRFYALEPQRLILFDANAQPLQEIPVPFENHKIFAVDNWLYLLETGRISVYDAEGQLTAMYLNDLLDPATPQHRINENRQFWQFNTHGQNWYSPFTPPSGGDWNWSRVQLRKFDLAALTETQTPEAATEDGFLVYPSPARSMLVLECRDLSLWGTRVQLEIISTTGRVVASQGLDRWPEKLFVHCGDWAPGIYLARIQTIRGIQTQKIMIVP